MRSINWSDAKISAQSEYQAMKATIALGKYLKDIPETGFIRDNRTDEVIKLIDCRTSTLNRLLNFIVKLYFTATSPENKEIILNKQKEIEAELITRKT